GPDGLVVGIDHDPAMIDAARERARRAGSTRWVRHELADALALPFEPGFFDACRSERLLQHTRDAAAALGERLRLPRPGGQVVVADADWGTLSIDSAERDTERRVVEFVRRTLGNAFAGRELFRLFGEAGLAGVAVEAWPIVWTDYAAFRATS